VDLDASSCVCSVLLCVYSFCVCGVLCVVCDESCKQVDGVDLDSSF